MITFPNISPVAFSIGSLEVRWYALAYIIGALIAFWYIKVLNKQSKIISAHLATKFFDDLLFYVLIGIIVGGRLGYVLFYGLSYYLQHPLSIFALWEGGMSYHGGLLGVSLAAYLLGRKYQKSFLQITDIIAPAMPIGLFLGRIANFINGELYGKLTDVSWGVVFPNVIGPRHPSQLYEAFFEGIVLFIILYYLWHKKLYLKVGFISAYTIILYGIFRFLVEFFRVGEIYFFNLISMGQVLSLIMIIIGLVLLQWLIFKKH
ncbi:Prolipoprotein diacylglyceryl transferase [Candidatus Hepatincola sp. Av]